MSSLQSTGSLSIEASELPPLLTRYRTLTAGGRGSTLQAKDASALCSGVPSSLTLTVTSYGELSSAFVAKIPVMSPEGEMDNPSGRLETL